MDPPPKLKGVHLLACSLRFDEESLRAAIKMASTAKRATVRITGSAGSFDPCRSDQLFTTILSAFDGCDFTVIAGGTRMVTRDTGETITGITEVLPLVSQANPNARVVGVIPRQTDLLLANGRLVVSDKPGNTFITIVHPELDACLLLQYSADKGFSNWDKEWVVSLDYLEALRKEAGHKTLHLVYGGGPATERELLHVLNLPHNPANPWWVVLIADAGGVSERYARQPNFCEQYADRLVVCNASSLRTVFDSLGFTQATP